MSESLGIVLFTSTKGHFGRKDTYKYTVRNLLKYEAFCPFRKNAHIKVSEGEEQIANEMESWLRGHGFNVITTIGNWSHNDPSHASGYTEDIARMFSNQKVLESEYSLFLEDDWILSGEVARWMRISIDALQRFPQKLCVRSNHGEEFEDDVDCHLLERFSLLWVQGPKYSPWGPTFTFQPTIVRTRDMFQAYRIIRNNWNQLSHMHIELVSGIGMKTLSDDPCPFLFVDPELCHSIHIGTEEFNGQI